MFARALTGQCARDALVNRVTDLDRNRNMKKLKLDVAQHVSIVGQRVGSNDEFVKIVGNAQ